MRLIISLLFTVIAARSLVKRDVRTTTEDPSQTTTEDPSSYYEPDDLLALEFLQNCWLPESEHIRLSELNFNEKNGAAETYIALYDSRCAHIEYMHEFHEEVHPEDIPSEPTTTEYPIDMDSTIVTDLSISTTTAPSSLATSEEPASSSSEEQKSTSSETSTSFSEEPSSSEASVAASSEESGELKLTSSEERELDLTWEDLTPIESEEIVLPSQAVLDSLLTCTLSEEELAAVEKSAELEVRDWHYLQLYIDSCRLDEPPTTPPTDDLPSSTTSSSTDLPSTAAVTRL